MAQRTALYDWHMSNQGKIVNFSGWDMPVNYGSQIEEHHAVRQKVGLFDVSHMTIVDINGGDAREYLRILFANDVAKLDGHYGKALYTAMLNPEAGVMDDLIVYNLTNNESPMYRLVVNCGTREKDLAWIRQQAEPFSVDIHERDDISMIALQGPEVMQCIHAMDPTVQDKLTGLENFQATTIHDVFYARTGYTGEEGFEIILASQQVVQFWESLIQAGATACGLGARDTLRLEAGMNLYGNEMDDGVSPLSANMGWTIAWEPDDREFIGREALTQLKEHTQPQRLVGILLEAKGIIRAHQPITLTRTDGTTAIGETTSGTFSPTLGKSIGLARVPSGTEIGDRCEVEIRNRSLSAKIVKPCFVRHGKVII